jgi:hypothetical protein
MLYPFLRDWEATRRLTQPFDWAIIANGRRKGLWSYGYHASRLWDFAAWLPRANSQLDNRTHYEAYVVVLLKLFLLQFVAVIMSLSAHPNLFPSPLHHRPDYRLASTHLYSRQTSAGIGTYSSALYLRNAPISFNPPCYGPLRRFLHTSLPSSSSSALRQSITSGQHGTARQPTSLVPQQTGSRLSRARLRILFGISI